MADPLAPGISGAREGLSTVTRGTFVLLIGTFGFILENFIARVILVRTLTLSEWSDFSLGLTVSGLLAAFGSLGLGSAIARTLPYSSEASEQRQLIRTALTVVTPTAAVVAALLGFVALASPDHSITGLPVTLAFLAVAASLSILSGLIASVFQGFEDVSANAYFVQIINPLLFLGFLVAAYGIGGFHESYLGALLAYVASAAITLVVLVAYARIRLTRYLPHGPAAPGLSRRLLLFAVPLFLVAILSFLTQNADTLILGYFHGAEVGQYTASLSLARLLQLGIGSLGYIFLPVTTKFVRRGDTEAVRVTYTTATKWTVLTSLPFFLLFFFLPLGSMAFVYGANYALDATTLQVLVVGAFLSTLVGPSTQGQVAYGQTTLLLVNTLAAAVADLVLAFTLVPVYGILGAAIAWTAANALLPMLSALQLATTQQVHPFRPHYLVPLACTVLPLALLFLLVPIHPPPLTLPLLGIGIGACYGLAVWGTGSIDDGDRMLLEVVEGWMGFRLPLVHRLGRARRAARRPPPALPPRTD